MSRSRNIDGLVRFSVDSEVEGPGRVLAPEIGLRATAFLVSPIHLREEVEVAAIRRWDEVELPRARLCHSGRRGENRRYWDRVAFGMALSVHLEPRS